MALDDGRTSPEFRTGTWIGGLLALVLLYRLLVGTGAWSEWVAGASAAILATLAVGAVAAEVRPFRPRWSWLGLLLRRLPGQTLTNCARVIAALGRCLVLRRTLGGVFRVVPIDPGGDDARSTTRRALVIAGGSLPPNTIVVAIDRQRGLMLVHQLVPTPEPPGGGDREWPL